MLKASSDRAETYPKGIVIVVDRIHISSKIRRLVLSMLDPKR
jgi:hypothetical protein